MGGPPPFNKGGMVLPHQYITGQVFHFETFYQRRLEGKPPYNKPYKTPSSYQPWLALGGELSAKAD